MTESTTTEIVVSEAIATEGAALSVIHGKRESKARSGFRKDIAEGGFDVRLGNVMVELRSGLTEGERISSKLIKAAGISASNRCIPKGIRQQVYFAYSVIRSDGQTSEA